MLRYFQRKAALRRARYWGAWIEELDRRHKSHDVDMERAVAECHKAKAELAAIDIQGIRRPSLWPSFAPGRQR